MLRHPPISISTAPPSPHPTLFRPRVALQTLELGTGHGQRARGAGHRRAIAEDDGDGAAGSTVIDTCRTIQHARREHGSIRNALQRDGAQTFRIVTGPAALVGCIRDHRGVRSEEHTSELQSLMRISYAVFCLKKKKTLHTH